MKKEYFKQKFEPMSNNIIHGAGQSSEQFKKYWAAVGKNKPVIYMEYIKIGEIVEKLPKKLELLLGISKNLCLQLGLNLKPRNDKEKCKEISEGKFDEELEILIKILKDFKNPVFLRIGYECNDPTHSYNPKDFILAWKHIVQLFRKNMIENVAFVWCACTAFNRDIKEIMEFYPGDDYIDWFGNDLFGIKHFKDNKDKVTEDFCKEAERHKKPLMIGESSPAKIGVDKGQESWNNWFEPYFRWIKSHEVVKAFCYIDWDWGKDWKQPEWLNGRIEENEIIMKKYVEELSNRRYIHNQPISKFLKLVHS